VLGELLASRGFEFAVERAVFASVLHRLFESDPIAECITELPGLLKIEELSGTAPMSGSMVTTAFPQRTHNRPTTPAHNFSY
jgi:hypothetical protein